ncbi:hypothetical protein ERO13_D05G025066v2 [Gossypium hirsutum]|nr:hypothetical protein ERO13_D05G025066v2 [Gossypium hirsutum]
MSSAPPGATPAPTSPLPATNTTSPPPTAAATPPPTTTPSPPPVTPSAPPPSTTPSPPPPSTSSPPPSSSASPPPPATESHPHHPQILPLRRLPHQHHLRRRHRGVPWGSNRGVAILLVLGLLFLCCKKKRRRRDEESYYMPPPPTGPKDDPYGGQQYRWQQNPPPRVEQFGAVAPKPTPPPVTAWRPPSPGQSSTPPPPFISSSGGSGSNYSGSENPLPPPSPGISLGFSKSTFSYEELARATDGFSEVNLLGQGWQAREFQAEVEIISRVHHKHLVSLVGYCISGTIRMLVYEFVPNNTLEFHLHGHPKIIHRDIKAANILLDFKFEAKVADFGLAKIASDVNTHVSTRVMGTFGYLAPEYASSGKLTDKSDVFSFGARPLLTKALDGNFDGLVDPKLQKEYNHNEMTRMVACAAACVRHSARRRPRMSQIVRALEGDASLSDLNEGMRPGQSGVYSSYGSSDYDTSQYNEDMKNSEYSEPTSEYGLYPSGSSNEGQTTREMEMGKMKRNSYGFSGNSTS